MNSKRLLLGMAAIVVVGAALPLAVEAIRPGTFGPTHVDATLKPARLLGALYEATPATLASLVSTLKPGDTVTLAAGTYAPIVIGIAGTEVSPITFVGAPGPRPVFSGGTDTLTIAGSHLVFEHIEVTGGTNRCIFHHGFDNTIRDVVVHDCAMHGLLGADNDSGSLLLESSEFFKNGLGDQKHQIYMSSDELNHPGSVFRMRYCYVHDGAGGINVKSRAERNEIYSNWLSGGVYYDLDLIGSQEYDENVAREDSDVVGNVLVRDNEESAVRFGGDGSGESWGRYRFVNNTVLVRQVLYGSPVFRLVDGLDSVEMHNNVFMSLTAQPPDLIRDVDAKWTSGTRTVSGSDNWVQTGATTVPPEWTGTLSSADPGFASMGALELQPDVTSRLFHAGDMAPSSPTEHPFPSPLPLPLYEPPREKLEAPVARIYQGAISIGAFEPADGTTTTSAASTSAAGLVTSAASTGAGSSTSTTSGSAASTSASHAAASSVASTGASTTSASSSRAASSSAGAGGDAGPPGPPSPKGCSFGVSTEDDPLWTVGLAAFAMALGGLLRRRR